MGGSYKFLRDPLNYTFVWGGHNSIGKDHTQIKKGRKSKQAMRGSNKSKGFSQGSEPKVRGAFRPSGQAEWMK